MLQADKSFIAFRDIQKSYDGKSLVVKSLNLDVGKGDFLTLLGPSGSGKTTTLMMLAGFEAPTHGHIELGGKDITTLPPHKRNIGMVFQNYALFPHMTVAENIAFPLKVRGVSPSEISEQVARALDMVRLPDFASRRPGQLSGGQQQRVAVARALVFSPDLVLMDEPLGALDKNLREELQYEIKQIHEETQITVVYVTHDQSEALTMSSQVAVFDDGIIQQLNTPEMMYEAPTNAFVANFIGENNCLPGTVLEVCGDEVKVALTGRNETIVATNVINLTVGDQTRVCIRPERMAVGADGGDNQLSGTLQSLIYLGDHIRLVLAAPGVDDFVIKVPNAGGLDDLHVNERIQISFSPINARALDG